jgi:AcrR family transcriptional regulator
MAEPTAAGGRRGRGRPPKSEGLVTAQRLTEAAATICATQGFDGATLARIAARAGVHPTAVYNHFESREDLLYAAARRSLEQMTAGVFGATGGKPTPRSIAAAYLQPSMREQRRVLAEIHVASGRDERLATLLAEWHRATTEELLAAIPHEDPNPRASIKAFFLLLLGLCHLEDLPAITAPAAEVAERVEALAAHLFSRGSS